MSEYCVIKHLLDNPFGRLKYEDKVLIIKNGRPTPSLPQLHCMHKEKNRKTYKRCFNVCNYEKYLWLCGSSNLNKLYCWPCLLFSTERSPWNTIGFANLSYLITALSKHHKSTSHIRSFTILKTFGSQIIDRSLNLQQKIADDLHNEKVKDNRNVLKRLIDAVIFLGKQECSFRGHDESDNSLNKGNYIEFLHSLANYDQVLSHHLKTATTFKGTSAIIQNDLIDAVADVVSDEIKSNISKATFVSIILDVASDITNKNQLSTIVRFVDEDGNNQERFITITDFSSDRTARGLFKHINKTVDNLNISNKLVALTFDGAAVISGHVSGLQTLIKAQYPAATFIHCYSHRFSLILSQSVNFIKETRQFFVSLNGLRAYFSHSTLRTDALRNFTEKKMPDVSPTCWNFASRLVTTVHEYRSHLIDFFVSIEDEPGDWTSEEVNTASGFVRFFSKVQTIFFLILFSKIFAFSNILFDILQINNMNMSYCTEKVNEFVFTLQKLRDTEFKEMWSKAVSDNQKDGDESWSKRRNNCSDEEILSRIFSEVLDTIISQTRLRFESLKQLKFVALLNCKRFDNYNENFPTDIFYELKEPYSTYFDLLALKNELKVLYSLEKFSGKSVQDIVHYMKLNDLHVVYPEVYKLATLVLTFPSSAPSVERSFSALKRIKTYLRSTQGQIHMSNLVLLSIEKDILISLRTTNEDVFFNDVITKFINKKRRLEFICRRKENSSTEANKGPATRKSQKEIERINCPSLNEVMTENLTPWVSESVTEDSSHSEEYPLSFQDEMILGTSSSVITPSLPGRPSIVMPSLSVRPSLVMTSLPGPSSVDIASIPHSSSMHLNPVVAIRIVPPLAETVEMPSPQLAQSGITSSGVQNTIVGQSLHISQQNIPVLGNDTSTVLGSGQLETNEVDLALNRLEDISNKVKQLHNREDYFDYFGKYVAALLRSLPIQKAMNMQQEVIKLILTSHTNPEVLSKELVSPLARPSLTNVTPSSETPEAVDLEERLLPAPQSLEPSSVQNVNGDISFSISQQNEKGEKRPHPDDMSHKVENKHAKFCDLLEQTGEIEESLKRLENISNQINQLCGRDDHFDDFGRYSASLLRGLNTQKAIEMQGEVIALILK